MDISNFLTQQVQNGTGKPLSTGALGGKTGLFALPPGMSFMDLLFKTPNAALPGSSETQVTADNNSGASLSGLSSTQQESNGTDKDLLGQILARLGENAPPELEEILTKALNNKTNSQESLPQLLTEIKNLLEAGELPAPVLAPENSNPENPAAALHENIKAYIDANPDSKLAALVSQTENKPQQYQAALKAIAQMSAVKTGSFPPADVTDEDIAGANNDSGILIDDGEENGSAQQAAPFSSAAGRKKFTDLMNHLLQGLPQENRPQVIQLPPGLLRKAMGNLEFNPESTDGENPALIAAEITPEKLEEFMNKIQQESENGQSFIIGLVKILPAESEKAVIFKPRAIILPPAGNSDTRTGESDTAQNIASRLNDLIIGEQKQDGAAKNTPRFDFVLQTLEQRGGRAENIPAPFSQAGTPQFDNGAKPDLPQPLQNTPVRNDNAPAPKGLNTNTIQAGAQNPGGALSFDGLLETVFPESLPWANSAGTGQSMSFNSPAQMTSLLSQNTHAGQPHPATQMVTAAIARATTNGENRNIQIKLNPPELGRVEIRMEFKKDNSGLKTQIIIEKPETYMMLQRDAHALERALNQTGIDPDGSALSMELAQDGSLFDHDDRGGNGGERNTGGNDNDAAADEENTGIIETTVDWHIDPDTGLTRYSMLV